MRKTKRNIARKAKRSTNHKPQATSHGAQRHGQGHTEQLAPAAVVEHSPIPGTPSGFVSQPDTKHAAPDITDDDPLAQRNRQNAQRSTGPRTEEGKARSSQNAFKHGLSLQRHVILQHEDPAQYLRLLAELRDIFEPQSRREDLSVEDIAQCRWALRRFDEGESTLFEYHFARNADPAVGEDNFVSYGAGLGYIALQEPGESPCHEYPSLLLLQRYRGHWDRRHQRALTEFDRAQRARRQEARELRQHAGAARKAEREAAAERRKQEMHELRMALAREKLHRERSRNARARSESGNDAWMQAMEAYLQSPPPISDEEILNESGFVSSDGWETNNQAEIESEREALGAV